MLIVELGVKCKTRECDGVSNVGVITVESQKALGEWIKGFNSQDIHCPTCKRTALYSRADLQANLLET
jgi:hypothetical protein